MHQAGTRPAGEPVRQQMRCRFSYNGAATTTILFPRLSIGTGSDANPQSNVAQGLVVGYKRMRLQRITLNNANAWGITTISLRAANVYTSYSTIGTFTTQALGIGINLVELNDDHVIEPGQAVAVGFTPDGAQHGYSMGLLDFIEV